MKPVTRFAVGIVALTAFSIPAAAASADPATCGQVISTPGTVITLTGNLHCDGTALTVAADNVTVDLHGFALKGSATDPSSHHSPEFDPRYDGYAIGVHVVGAQHTRITGGTIDGFDAGLVADNATNVLADSLTIRDFSGWGIWATATNGLTVSGATISGRGTDSADVPSPDADFGLVDAGVKALFTAAVRVEDSTISLVPGQGIFADSVGGLEVFNTVVTNNLGNGIDFTRPPTGTSFAIDTVSASDNGRTGIIGDFTNGAQVSLNRVEASRNGHGAIWLASTWDIAAGSSPAYNATITNSTASANGGDVGIALGGAGVWRLTNNTASGNRGEGFYAYGGTIISSGNLAKDNRSNGFYWNQGLNGSSTSDVATGNQGSGVMVDNDISGDGGSVMTLTKVSSSHNASHGLLVKTGTAKVAYGTFNDNSLDGIRVANRGTSTLSHAVALRNTVNGVAFLGGSKGWAFKINSSHNGRYGLCKEPTASYYDRPPNTWTDNAGGDRVNTCLWIHFVPRWF